MKIFQLAKPIAEKFPGLARLYRTLRDMNSLDKPVEFRRDLGFYFNGSLEMELGLFEPNETRIFEHYLNQVDCFVNIGANTGYYVCRALKRGVATIAFEPNQLNVSRLLKNVEANAFTIAPHIFPVALSDKPGILPLFGANTGASLVKGWAGQDAATLVPVAAFDQIAAPMISGKRCFVLIDVEGAELSCLRGAQTLLKSDLNVIFLIEISVAELQPEGVCINPNLVETFSFMERYGYKSFTASRQPRQISLSEVQLILDTQINTLEVHNFIFVKDPQLVVGADFS